MVLILAIGLNLIYALPPKDELLVMLHQPLLPYQQRLRLKLGSPFYEYLQFLYREIPPTASVAIPPETQEWGMYGNFLYMQSWLYPRPVTTDQNLADYSLVIRTPSAAARFMDDFSGLGVINLRP